MALRLQQIEKVLGDPPTTILHGISLEIPAGSFVTITGRSGSGKTSLMYLMSTLDRPTRGSVVIDDRDMATLSASALHQFRNQQMGFVFQFHHLLPELTALENVLLAPRKAGQLAAQRDWAVELLARVELADKQERLPNQLSGGERQRVAIARALAMRPRFVFADEPTGNLDSQSGDLVMQILRDINRDLGTTVVYVTHDPDYAALAARQIHLVDGRVVPI
ncbi:MAG: ABC transporter ATP-binding protein [Deltaproteobacteria bacterium]|nr:ABC transporter ATP-binding protein [Deltaproteobacteria bacterium]